MLLEHGATVIEDDEGRTAIQTGLGRGNHEIMKLLSGTYYDSARST